MNDWIKQRLTMFRNRYEKYYDILSKIDGASGEYWQFCFKYDSAEKFIELCWRMDDDKDVFYSDWVRCYCTPMDRLVNDYMIYNNMEPVFKETYGVKRTSHYSYLLFLYSRKYNDYVFID